MPMNDLNKVLFTGTVDSEIVVREGKKAEYATFTVKIVNQYKNTKTGEYVDKPAYVNLIAFGNRAHNIAKYSGNGCKVLVEASIKSNEVTNEKGTRHYMELQVENIRFLSFREGTESPENDEEIPKGTSNKYEESGDNPF